MKADSRHQCLIYQGSPSEKLPALAMIIKARFNEGYRCLYLNSPPMVAGMKSTLAAHGVDLGLELEKGSLIFSSDTVSSGNEFSSKEMLFKLESSLDQALADGYKGLWASGDMTWEFGADRDFSKLMNYELELEQLFKRRKELCGICQYHQDTLPNDVMRQSLLLHPRIVISDTLARINSHYLKSSWPVNHKLAKELDDTLTGLYSQ